MASVMTYREDHNDIFFAFDDNGKIESDLESLERFMDPYVLYDIRWNEARRGAREVRPAGGGSLYTQPSQYE